MTDKFVPINLNIYIGPPKEVVSRKEAYDKAAKKEGLSVSEWAKKHLDKASGFKPD